MAKGKNKKPTKTQNQTVAPKGAPKDKMMIPRNPRYNALDARDTPVSVRGVNLVYNALGSTDAGRLWALLALHPCGEYVSSCDGIPDASMASAVTPSYRAQTTVGFNSALFATPPSVPTGDFLYDVQIVTPPFPEIDYLYRIAYNKVWSKWVAVRLPGFPLSSDTKNPAAAKTLDDIGVTKYRFVGRGMTLYLDAPQLSDQGRYIGGQVAPKLSTEMIEWSGEYQTPTTGDAVYGVGDTILYGIQVPTSEDELVLLDTACAQWPARDGCYIPHRFVDAHQDYKDVGDGQTASAPIKMSDGTAATTSVPTTFLTVMKQTSYGVTIDNSMDFDHSTDGSSTTPWLAPSGKSGLSPSLGVWGVSVPGNLYTGVSFFKSISSQASIQVKSRVYLECEPGGIASAAAPFSHKPPVLDRQALDMVTKVAQVQPHVFLARDNDLSSILLSIGKMLPGILGWAETIGDRAYKSRLPWISPIGQGIGAVSRGVRATMDHLLETNK